MEEVLAVRNEYRVQNWFHVIQECRTSGLINREFYPKGRNLSRVAPATLKRKLALINARPRKVLNFHST